MMFQLGANAAAGKTRIASVRTDFAEFTSGSPKAATRARPPNPQPAKRLGMSDSKESLRPKTEEDQEDHQPDNLTVFPAEVEGTDRLRDAQQDSGQQCSPHAPQSGEHDHD